METVDRNDAMLMELMTEKQSIFGFFDAIFGFLSRWTDFYMQAESPDDNIGYMICANEQIALQILRKWSNVIAQEQEIFVDSEIEVATECEAIEVTEEADDDTAELAQAVVEDDDDDAIPKVTKRICAKQKVQFPAADYYNGAVFDTYCWSQTITDLEIHIALPVYITSAKQLIVHIESQRLRIAETNASVAVLEGEFFAKCKHTAAMWTLSNQKLHISLDKSSEVWWKQLFLDEPPLDLTRIDCSRPSNELPDDQQSAISKLQWDEHQKRLGNPTSDEIQQHEMLRKAWNVEGSPFKDTPFSPDTVKFG